MPSNLQWNITIPSLTLSITLLILLNKRLFPTTQGRLEPSILKSLAEFNYLESQRKQRRHSTTTCLTNIKQSESTAVSLMDRILFCPCYIFIWSNTHLPKPFVCMQATAAGKIKIKQLLLPCLACDRWPE